MAELVLRPRSVRVSQSPTTPRPGDLVGLDEALSDDSDATYAEVWTTTRAAQATQAQVWAPLPAVPDLGDLSALTLSVRVQIINEQNAHGQRFAAYLADSFPLEAGEIGHFTNPDGATIPGPPPGTIATISDGWFLLDNDTFPDQPLPRLATALRAGTAEFVVERLSESPFNPPADFGLRVYEMALTLTTVEPTTGRRFRRVWPREHGRVWPPPRHQHGRRTHGGYL